VNKEILHKYISGNCTSEEKELVEKWLNKSPENSKIMEQMKLIWGVSPGKRIEVDSHAGWKSFKSNSIDKESHFRKPEHDSTSNYKKIDLLTRRHYSKQRGWLPYRVMALTATIAAVFLVTFLFYSNNRIATETTKLELVNQEIITEKGQRTNVRLSDGTRIYMNAESKLTVPQNYMEDQRIVYLEGEAFFEVVPNSDKPFVVQAGHSVTRVLGTKFNVTAYPEKQKVQVVVAEGKVALSSDDQTQVPEVQLTRNQMGTISSSGEMTASKTSDVNIYTDWYSGRLTFQDTPLDEVEKRLERWYNVDIKIDEDISIQDHLLHGTFEDASLTSVLNSIALSLDIQYQRNNKEIHFMLK
jgi:ferric-dicitrate binding protein FerR (iron transport regulator)